MDIGAMKKDLAMCLDALPKGIINPKAVGEWIAKHRGALKELVPDIIETLKPHFMAAIPEMMAGILEQDEIEKACIEVLLSYGVTVPEESGAST